ncbi:MAG: NAD-dependent epimerase/dehydratase family protein [Bdellovibrionaceae bacterium]|nr:NAD-dependent epimerase/dehydratase family protein [Pseudobdellovibrionaceae bacterium]
MTSILITGATGYTGRFLANKLSKMGFDVHTIQRLESNVNETSLEKEITVHRIKIDFDSILNLFNNHTFETVFHLASHSSYQCEPDEIPRLIESNILFGIYILEAMAKCGCKNIINTGSYWQHFETIEKEPICLYAATKQAFEDIINYYVFSKKISAISLKLYDTYGPEDNRKNFST